MENQLVLGCVGGRRRGGCGRVGDGGGRQRRLMAAAAVSMTTTVAVAGCGQQQG
jgi:hypothetical protein